MVINENVEFRKFSRVEPQKFGLVLATIWIILFTILFFWKNSNLSYIFLFLSLAVFSLTIFSKKGISKLNQIWHSLFLYILNIISYLTMFFIYFFFVIPLGLVKKLFEFTFIKNKKVDTYWINQLQSYDIKYFKEMY